MSKRTSGPAYPLPDLVKADPGLTGTAPNVEAASADYADEPRQLYNDISVD